MDAQLKAKWVEALRSDKFSQCRNEIGYDGHYCCIGVAGHVAGFDEGHDWGTYSVADRLGLEAKIRDHLIQMNDRAKVPFEDIADYIEANL